MDQTSQYHITFRSIPQGLTERQPLWVAEFALSGIQRYLFGEGDIHISRATLCRRSAHVENLTAAIDRRLEASFKDCDYRCLSRAGGKVLCAFSRKADLSALNTFGQTLQQQVFASTEGQLELYFAFVPTIVRREDSSEEPLAVERELSLRLQAQKYHPTDLLFADLSSAREEGLTLAALVPQEEMAPAVDGAGMAMKFDLDNLGLFFGKISAFDERMAAADALKEVLEAALDESVYIGGDDLFAVAPLENALGIAASMYRRICAELETRPPLAPYCPHFGLSGGICQTALGESLPLIYGFNAAEEQLELAKSIPGKNRVVVEGSALTWEQLCLLARMEEEQRDLLFAGMDPAAIRNEKRDVRRLAQRILACHRKAPILQPKEVQALECIH